VLLANTGVPMIAVQLPVMAIALLPIVLVEAAIYLRLGGTSWSSAWRGSLLANAVSTFIDIPIAWFVQLMILMLVGGGSAWGMEYFASSNQSIG
jgi:hypothetical protein